MKLGTFVGQENVQTTEKENAFVENAIKSVMQSTFPNAKYSLKKYISEYGTHFTLNMFGNGVQNYRNKYNDLVRPKHITISFYKSKGYDEAKVGKFYEWEKGFKPVYDVESYTLNISVCGDERGYRKQYVARNVGIVPTSYTYGTEIDDLQVSSSLWNVLQEIKYFTPVKKNLI